MPIFFKYYIVEFACGIRLEGRFMPLRMWWHRREREGLMGNKDDERNDLPVDLIIDKMRDDYEGRHWGDDEESDEESDAKY